ncbi:defensin-B-like [Anastrepha ludens]|uniref:defensin-B-like n=1 Tax=Anastrepha ludens TaxID=28586 RepID=UPI0023AFEE77|nr:defensin-B-like [Anastrepha ludens]
MKIIALLAFLICSSCILGTIAALADETALTAADAISLPAQLATEREMTVENLVRQKRFTCNSYACSAHCIILGKRQGGYCNRQNACVCRK